MKPEELRIGNITEQGTIKTFYEYGIHVGLGICFIFKELDPVEITKEWLLKLGFKKRNIKWFDKSISKNIYEYKGYCVEFIDENYKVLFELKLNDIVRQSNYIANIKHVHQLQNLYYALTEQELKIIKK